MKRGIVRRARSVPLSGWVALHILVDSSSVPLADPLRPNETACPDGGEELEILERESPEVTGPGEWVGKGHWHLVRGWGGPVAWPSALRWSMSTQPSGPPASGLQLSHAGLCLPVPTRIRTRCMPSLSLFTSAFSTWLSWCLFSVPSLVLPDSAGGGLPFPKLVSIFLPHAS